MPVTIRQAVTQVRALLDEPNAQFWTTTQLIGWINQGSEDVARRAEILWTFHTTTVHGTPPQQNYDLPPNFLSLHRAEFVITDGPQIFPLTFVGYNAMDDIWGILQSIPAAYPNFCTIWRNNTNGWYLRLFPVPGANGKLNVFYYREATVRTGLTTLLDCQGGWEDLVYDYATYKAKQKDRDPLWKTHFDLYESRLVDQINRTRNMTDLADRMTSGPGQLPLSAYSTNTWFT